MKFSEGYTTPMDREYFGSSGADDLEQPIIGVADMGQTVSEGSRVGGSFRDNIQAAIRSGARQVELSTQMEGSDKGVGAEAYGKEAREELRELQRANDIKVVSTHTPTQIGNLSGYTGPERGFDDDTRKRELDEVKKALSFAAEAAGGGAVVVHTGEYMRPISEQKWAKDDSGEYLFKGYLEEAERAVIPIVDSRTGRVVDQVRKNQIVHRPEWLKNDKGEYINYENEVVGIEKRVPIFDSASGRFKVREMRWADFEKEAEERNKLKEKKLSRSLNEDEILTTEEAFLQAQIESNVGHAKGWALQYARGFEDSKKNLENLKKAKEFYDKLDESLPEEDKWKIMKESSSTFGGLLPSEYKPIPEILADQIKKTRHEIESAHEASVSQEQQAETSALMGKYAMPVDRYAKQQSMKSYAEAGITAMEQSELKKTDSPVFIAPENLFPEMGYGTHPEELIELVYNARKAMVKTLTQKQIVDPSGKLDDKGNPVMVNNPHYRGWNEKKAQKEAKEHIRATLDTAHLGLWWKYFEPRTGETRDDRFKRFEGWYMDQIKNLEKADVIGHVHVVDTMGRGDSHLPAGQGIMPVKTALEYLKEKGLDASMVSEAFGEGPGRQLTKTWEHFGSPIYGATGPVSPGAPTRFSDIHQSYFGKDRPPYYVFGAYSPSNDWTLWTQVPLE